MVVRLNADFKVSPASTHKANVLIILESRGGGGQNARNPDYSKQLSRILRLLQKNSCTITRIELLSSFALKNVKKTKLNLAYPIDLSKSTNIESLRKAIQNAQKSVGRRPGVQGGNSTKRIGIFVKTGTPIAVAGIKSVLA